MRPLRDRVHGFVRESDWPERLAVFRIGLFGFVFVMVTGIGPRGMDIQTAARFSDLPHRFLDPVKGWKGLYAALGGMGIDVHATAVVVGVGIAIAVASLLACIGYHTRIFAWCTAGLLVYYLLVFHSYGKVNHNHHLVWFAAIIATSNSGDVWSVDRLRTPPERRTQRRRALAYGWPVRLSWLLLGVIYLFPGLAKLQESGLAWAFSDNLMNQIYAKWMTHAPLVSGVDLEPHSSLLRAAALVTLVFEVGFLAAMFDRRLRPVAAGTGFGFHLATWALMGISFAHLWPVYATFLPWHRVAGAPASTQPTGPQSLKDVPVAARAMGVSLLVGALLAGVGGSLNGWPFAHYPKFAGIAGGRRTVLVLEVDGQRQAASDLVPWMPAARMLAIVRKVQRRPDHFIGAFRELADIPDSADINLVKTTYDLGPHTTTDDEPVRVRRLELDSDAGDR